MDFQRILFDLITNLFIFFIFELYVEQYATSYSAEKKLLLRKIYVFYYIIVALIPTIPYFKIIEFITDLLYLYILDSYNIKNTCFDYAKFYFIYSLVSLIFYLLYTLINEDLFLYYLGDTYYNFKSLTCTLLEYIIFRLHINRKILKQLHIHTLYPLFYGITSVAAVLFLMLSNKFFIASSKFFNTMSILFVIMLMLIILSLNTYQKLIDSLSIKLHQEMLIEKFRLENSYYSNIEESLKTLARLRHDFKNHLIVLDGYATQGNLEAIHAYIVKINNTISKTKTISTNHNLVSSILNVKADLCEKQGIHFDVECSFEKIYLNDFSIITILGNILDNAISAAAKVPQGVVSLSIRQLDSYLEICCVNDHQEILKEKNGKLLSTKNSALSLHGFGIKNVYDTVISLNGTIDISYTDNRFSIVILIPNY